MAHCANLAKKIFDIFSGREYASDLVITVCTDRTNGRNSLQPFLRVVSTPSPHIDEIVELLKILDIDIEAQMLAAFHPKKNE